MRIIRFVLAAMIPLLAATCAGGVAERNLFAFATPIGWATGFIGGALASPFLASLIYTRPLLYCAPLIFSATLAGAYVSLPLMSIPASFFWIVAALVASHLLCVLLFQPIPEPAGHRACARCGYDLRGNVSGVCPECGSAIAMEARGVAQSRPSESHDWRRWVGKSVAALSVIALIGMAWLQSVGPLRIVHERPGRWADPSKLMRGLGSNRGEIRDAAIEELVRRGDVDLIAAALGDATPKARESAINAAIRLGDTAIFPSLRERLCDDDSFVRRRAVYGLGWMRDREAAPLVEEKLTDASPPVRAAAIEALVRLRSFGSVDKIVEQLSDSDGYLVGTALDALGALGSERHIPSMVPFTIDTRHLVAERAALAIARLDGQRFYSSSPGYYSAAIQWWENEGRLKYMPSNAETGDMDLRGYDNSPPVVDRQIRVDDVHVGGWMPP